MKVQGNKMDSIRMNYWGGHRNFGDELSPYLVEKITGKKVIHASQKEEDKLIALGSIVDFNNIYLLIFSKYTISLTIIVQLMNISFSNFRSSIAVVEFELLID